MTPRKLSSRHNRTDAHRNSQKLWQCTQVLHRFKPDGVLALREVPTKGRSVLTNE